MCGVGAILRTDPSQLQARSQAMLNAMQHRGPDGCGRKFWPEDEARLVMMHSRLTILDLSDASAQPMVRENVTLSFNGEIYNYVELRKELAQMGVRFNSYGDTEVILQGYLRWGEEVLSRLEGMFAILLHDPSKQVLIAARDPYGIKPLYYVASRQEISLASEVSALIAGTCVKARADVGDVGPYLEYGTAALPRGTMFRDVQQVPPGSLLRIDTNSLAISERTYFVARRAEQHAACDPSQVSFDEAAAGVREAFDESLQLHMRSDVPIGFALSGGVDSSSIVCSVRALFPDAELNCFTYAARGSSLDESRWAKLAAERARASIHFTSPHPRELLDDLGMVTCALGEPLSSTSIYAQFRVFKLARESGVKVVLDGQGADEIFAGYDRYVSARIASLVAAKQFGEARSLLLGARARGLSVRASALRAVDYFVPTKWSAALLRAAHRKDTGLLLKAGTSAAVARGRLGSPSGSGQVNKLHERLRRDIEVDTLPHLLRYEDRNSMFWSVESRVPFVTPQMVALATSLPESFLVGPNGEGKRVLKAAMRGRVPDAILDRRDKIGFAPPSANWIRQESAHVRLQLHDLCDALPFIDDVTARQLLDRVFISGVGADLVWRLLFLKEWAVQFNVQFS